MIPLVFFLLLLRTLTFKNPKEDHYYIQLTLGSAHKMHAWLCDNSFGLLYIFYFSVLSYMSWMGGNWQKAAGSVENLTLEHYETNFKNAEYICNF